MEYNGVLYVSSTSSYMMVLVNQIFRFSFSTFCSIIRTFTIDQNGVLAIYCETGIIYLYNSNGTYTVQSLQSPIYYPISINFDSSGNLVISNYHGLYIFSSLIIAQSVN